MVTVIFILGFLAQETSPDTTAIFPKVLFTAVLWYLDSTVIPNSILLRHVLRHVVLKTEKKTVLET